MRRIGATDVFECPQDIRVVHEGDTDLSESAGRMFFGKRLTLLTVPNGGEAWRTDLAAAHLAVALVALSDGDNEREKHPSQAIHELAGRASSYYDQCSPSPSSFQRTTAVRR